MNKEEAKKIASRNYTFIIDRTIDFDGKPIYFARVAEFQGCFGYGESPEEAHADVKLALIDMIEIMIQIGDPIPPENKIIESNKIRVENFIKKEPKLIYSTDDGLKNIDKNLEIAFA